jgi:peptidoglycan/LPS O-acetylase OafA/YrhL
MTTPELDLKGRIPELDGLRGIAIAMVLVYHFFLNAPIITPGTPLAYILATGRLAWSGVDLFFVLSGFLIGGILLDERGSSNYFRVFYTRRFFRIVPAYALNLALVFAFSVLLRLGFAKSFAWAMDNKIPWLPYLFFLQNFWMAAWTIPGVYGLGATWSLAVEEQFYLTLPLLIRLLDRRRLIRALVAGILLAPVLRIALHALWPNHGYSWHVMMPCRADSLLLGVLGAVALRDERSRNWLSSRQGLFRILAPVLLVGLAFLTLKGPFPTYFLMLSVGYTWLALSYLCLLLYAVLFPQGWVGRCLRWSWLRWLGSIAYGAYLFHGMVFGAILGVIWPGPPALRNPASLFMAVVALGVTLLLCHLSWLYFEKPLVKLGHHLHYNPKPLPAVERSLTVALSSQKSFSPGPPEL